MRPKEEITLINAKEVININVDFETRSRINLKKSGRSRYAEDPSTSPICMAFAVTYPGKPDGDISTWLPGQNFPEEILDALNDGGYIRGWNVAFEKAIWSLCVPPLWPDIPEHRFLDTMADAARCGYPLALDKCAKAIGATHKLSDGTRLINKLSKPKKDGTFYGYNDCPEDFEKMYRYCQNDVKCEREIFNLLPGHVQGEDLTDMYLTWRSNDRGVPVDKKSVKLLYTRIQEQILLIDEETQALTGNALRSPRQRDALLCHLECNRAVAQAHIKVREELKARGEKLDRLSVKNIPGITLANLQGETVSHVLSQNWLSDYDRKLLELHQLVNHASVAKFKRILLQICSDDTVKDNLQFWGSRTGRDAARGFQIQNLPRDTEKHPDQLLRVFRENSARQMSCLYDVLKSCSTLIRPMIWAPPGKKLVVSDYGQIEARGTSWTALEGDILQNFRDGIDPYKAQAMKMYDIPNIDEVGSDQRQYGKLAILACGYQGAHSALTKFAEGYGLVIDRGEAVDVVKVFREARPKLVNCWGNFGSAALHAVKDAGTPYQVNDAQVAVFQMLGRHLTLRLPSGRLLWYPEAEVRDVTVNYIDGATGAEKSFTNKAVTAMWLSSYTHRWERRGLSGGNLFQNYVQAICRDLLFYAVRSVEREGYDIVGRIHDELITTVFDNSTTHNIDNLNEIMCRKPDWAKGFPLDAAGYEDYRYHK